MRIVPKITIVEANERDIFVDNLSTAGFSEQANTKDPKASSAILLT